MGKPRFNESLLLVWKETIISKISRELIFHLSFTSIWILLDAWLKQHDQLYHYGLPSIDIALQPVAIFSVAISLIIQFRNNNAYQRFHEGRELWGGIVNDSRNFVNLIRTNVRYKENDKFSPQDLDKLKEKMILNVITLVYLIRDHLRDEVNEKMIKLPFFAELDLNVLTIKHKPNAVLMMLHKNLADLQESGLIEELNHYSASNTLIKLTDRLGGCERIKATPVPPVYSILTYRLIHLYLIWLALGLISINYLSAIIVIPLAAYIFFGFAEIGTEIQNPFSNSVFTFDLDAITNMIESNLEELILMPLTPPEFDESDTNHIDFS